MNAAEPPGLRKVAEACRWRMRFLSAVYAFAALTVASVYAATQLSLGNASGSPGSTMSVPSNVSSESNIVAVQYDVVFNPTNLSSAVPLGGNALANHALNSSVVNPGARRVLLYSLTNARLTNGILANLIFSIATNAPAGVSTITLTNAILSDAGGNRIEPVSLMPGTVTISLTSPARLGTVVLSTNGVVQFQLTGTANSSYIIQASTNLVQWVDLETRTATSGVINFTDTNANQFPYRFYRAKSAQ